MASAGAAWCSGSPRSTSIRSALAGGMLFSRDRASRDWLRRRRWATVGDPCGSASAACSSSMALSTEMPLSFFRCRKPVEAAVVSVLTAASPPAPSCPCDRRFLRRLPSAESESFRFFLECVDGAAASPSPLSSGDPATAASPSSDSAAAAAATTSGSEAAMAWAWLSGTSGSRVDRLLDFLCFFLPPSPSMTGCEDSTSAEKLFFRCFLSRFDFLEDVDGTGSSDMMASGACPLEGKGALTWEENTWLALLSNISSAPKSTSAPAMDASSLLSLAKSSMPSGIWLSRSAMSAWFALPWRP